MIWAPSSRRLSSTRHRAHPRANQKSAPTVSKPNRSCRSTLRALCAPRKSRCKRAATTTKAERYYHRGQQYSITALTDSSGNVTERYAYTAYGTPTITDGAGATLTTSADNNRYTYTGREWDETLSLYHYRARMYDSISGRFFGRDPIRYGAGDTNLFRFVGGRPLWGVDPSGLWTIQWDGNGPRTCGGLPWIGPTVMPRGSWSRDEQAQIGRSMDRIDNRISEILAEIEEFKSELSECELRLLKFEIETFANMLTVLPT